MFITSDMLMRQTHGTFGAAVGRFCLYCYTCTLNSV